MPISDHAVLAAVTDAHGRTSTASFALPASTPETGRLEVLASGVCGTDLALVREGRLAEPTILGHHVVGRIAEVGATARRRWGVDAGDLVAVQEYLPCHECRWCLAGEHRMCDRSDIRTGGRRFGMVGVSEPPSLWGGNAQAMHLPREALVHRLPAGTHLERAVWLLPLANAFDWVGEAGRLEPGGSVVVVGPGQHGLTCVVAARELGAEHIVVVGREGDEGRLEIAAKLGADTAVALRPGQAIGSILEAPGEGADLVVNTSGAGPAFTAGLLALAGKRGTVVEAGLADGTAPELDMVALTSRALRLVGARGRSHAAIDAAAASLAADGAGHPVDVIGSTFIGLDDLDDVLRPDADRPDPLPVHLVVRP